MRYIEVSQHALEDARPGLILIEQLMRDEDFRPYIYGLTTKEDVVLAAAEAVAEDAGEDDDGNLNTPKLTEVAIAIQMDSDALYYLQGSGLLMQFEEFAYNTPGSGEGTRTMSLRVSGSRPRVHLSDFTALAIAQDDMFLDNFYDQYATKATEAEAHAEVTREAPAVEPEATPTKAASKSASTKFTSPIDSFLAS